MITLTGLAGMLREGTRELHQAAEAQLDLHRRLVDRAGYGRMLQDLHGFYSSAEESLLAIRGWEGLDPAIDIHAHARVDLLEQDLDALELAVSAGQSRAFMGQGSLAAGLGCLYVVEGSTLGGRIVARQAQERFGADLPVAFFTGGHDPGARWHALKSTLNRFGAVAGPAEAAVTLAAARDTFTALNEWLAERKNPGSEN